MDGRGTEGDLTLADVQDAEKRIRDLVPVTPLKVRAPPPLRGHGKWTSFYASVASLDGLRNLSCCPSCWGLTCSSKETSTLRRAGEGVGVVGGSDPTTGPVCVVRAAASRRGVVAIPSRCSRREGPRES